MIWDRLEASYFSDEAVLPFLEWCRTHRPVCGCDSAAPHAPLLPSVNDPALLIAGKSSSPAARAPVVMPPPPPPPHAAHCPFYIPPLGVSEWGGSPAPTIDPRTRRCFSSAPSRQSATNMSLSYQVAIDASDARVRAGVFDNVAALPEFVYSSHQAPILQQTPSLLSADATRLPPHALQSAASSRSLFSRHRSATDPRAHVLSPFSQVVSKLRFVDEVV